EDFNLSTPVSTTVIELAELIWAKVHGGARPFRHVADEPFRYDVQCRIPDVTKARERLGFEATTTLSAILDEVIPWVPGQIRLGVIGHAAPHPGSAAPDRAGIQRGAQLPAPRPGGGAARPAAVRALHRVRLRCRHHAARGARAGDVAAVAAVGSQRGQG